MSRPLSSRPLSSRPLSSRPGPGRLGLAALWTVPSAVLLAVAFWVYSTYRITVPPNLDATARAAVVGHLRAALAAPRAAGASTLPIPARKLPHGGPLVVSVMAAGTVQARVTVYADTLDRAVPQAAARLAAQAGVQRMSQSQRREARIKVDLVVGRGPLADDGYLVPAFGLHPGLEGLGVSLAGVADPVAAGSLAAVGRAPDGRTELLLLADELILARLFGSYRPLPFIPEFTLGFDFERAEMRLAQLAQLPTGGYGAAQRSYFRLRTDSFIEAAAAARAADPIPLSRGLPPRPPVTAERLRAGALAGGRYLVAHLAANGRYIYERDLTSGRGTAPVPGGDYSIPRHAGTTYFLAELYRITGESFLREPVERAFAHLEELIRDGGCTGKTPAGTAFACVVDNGETVAHLGSTALTVVALAEYQRATGDDRYLQLARALTAWLRFMQRADGSFAHLYRVPEGAKDEDAELLYYSGEAALALARMHTVTGERDYIEAAERALDYLVGWYDFFLGGFFYGEEHWTCIAAEAAYPALDRRAYERFCTGYGAFLRAQQARPGEFPDQAAYVGSYNLTPFLVPQNTPAGSRTEAMISAYLLSKYHGDPDEAIRAQVTAALGYVLGQQIGANSDFSVAEAVAGSGAVGATPVDRMVRIDYVQHVCSAMIRAIELVESHAP